MAELADLIIKRQAQLEDLRLPWERLWQDIADYVVPVRANIKSESKGTNRATKIYDGSPLAALELFADGLHGYLVSPSIQWFRLKMADPRLNAIPEVKEWLQETEKTLYSAFQRSNFYTTMGEFFIDAGSIGTSTIYSEEYWPENTTVSKILFHTRHCAEICIAENEQGIVDTVYRKYKIQARQAAKKFGKENLSLSLQNALEKNPFTEFEFIHALFPREERQLGKLNAKNKPFASYWLQLEGKKMVLESGYDSNPFSVWRYRKASNEVYGRSPASTALSDIIGLNLISKTLLKAAELSVEPAYNVPSELLGKVRILPRGMNYYDDEKRVISPVLSGINFPVGIDREDKKREIIQDHFKVDFFLMLSRAERQMTATEIIERQGEKAAVLGTAIGRLNYECLDPTIDRTFDIEYNAGRIDDPPDILLEQPGARIDVDYMGPLAQAQKRLFQTQGIIRSLEGLKPILDVNPDSADIVDWDDTARQVLESYGMPQKTIRSMDEVLGIREARAQFQKQQLTMENMERIIQQSKTVAEVDDLSGGKLSEAIKNLAGNV